jgi:hypothetical protein
VNGGVLYADGQGRAVGCYGKYNSVKELLSKTSDPVAADQLRDNLNILLNTHFKLIDQLG